MDTAEKAQKLQQKYDGQDGPALLERVIREEFPEKIALVSSFGIESAVLVDMVAKVDPALPILFLDTQKLFPETLEYRDTLVKQCGLKNVRTIYPDYNDIQRSDPNGELWEHNPSSCCYIRKVAPLQKALKGFEAWITGRKRFHGGLRGELPTLESFEGRIKINPLARWSREQIMAEFETRGLPPHSLEAEGYGSVGCAPCTEKAEDGADIRAGRWAGQDKTECGIHLGDDGTLKRSTGT